MYVCALPSLKGTPHSLYRVRIVRINPIVLVPWFSPRLGKLELEDGDSQEGAERTNAAPTRALHHAKRALHRDVRRR